MKPIRIIIALSLLTFVSTTMATCQTKESKLALKAILRGSYELTKNDSCYYFLVDAQLCNNTDSLCTFVAYTCLTNFNIITDSKQAFICPNQCASNFPTIFRIKANQVFSISIIIKVNKNSPIINSPIKIGLILLQHRNFQEFIEVLQEKREKHENVIWSDSFDLQIAAGKPYEIY